MNGKEGCGGVLAIRVAGVRNWGGSRGADARSYLSDGHKQRGVTWVSACMVGGQQDWDCGLGGKG